MRWRFYLGVIFSICTCWIMQDVQAQALQSDKQEAVPVSEKNPVLEDVEQLIKQLKSTIPEARANALRVLLAYEDTRIPDAVIECLNDPHPDVRKGAIVACGHFRIMASVPQLIEMLNNDHWWTQLSARFALFQIAGENLGKEQAPWQQWWNSRLLEKPESSSLRDTLLTKPENTK